MTKNPLYNALAALAYIIVVACLMFYGTQHIKGPDTILAPIAFLSLFTMSAAFMSYTFFFNPVQMYLDGKKKEAVELFSKTLLFFAAITSVFLLIYFSGILKGYL